MVTGKKGGLIARRLVLAAVENMFRRAVMLGFGKTTGVPWGCQRLNRQYQDE
jgi:hypothetical protein